MIRATLLLALLAGCANATISNDMGGNVDTYAHRIEQMRQKGLSVKIDGPCNSACTMFLLVGCVTPKATLGFHSARSDGRFGPLAEARANGIMAAHYPQALQQWFWAKGVYAKGNDLIHLSAQELVKLGAKECGA